jgi:ribonuclease P/MRP protein subunit POP1
MWQPCQSDKTTDAIQSNNAKGKGKEKAQDSTAGLSQPLRARSVWLRFHPCIHNDILDTLKEAASKILTEYKAKNPATNELKLEIIDRRYQFNIFEIMGPKSSQVLRGVLRPVMPDKRDDFLKAHSSSSLNVDLNVDMIPSFGMSSVACKVLGRFQEE